MSARKTPAKRKPSKLADAGFTPASYGRCVEEAAAERGLVGHEAELFAQEAWAEMED